MGEDSAGFVDFLSGGLQHPICDFAMELTYDDANADGCVVQLCVSVEMLEMIWQTSADPAVVCEQLGEQDGAIGGAHLGIVGDEDVFDAVVEGEVLAQSADDGRHAVVGVAVQARLGPVRLVSDEYGATGC